MFKKFGKLPKRNLKKRIKGSPYYKNNKFRNLEEKPVLTEGVSMFDVLKSFFSKGVNTIPARIPITETNLFTLNDKKDYFIWFGHSSYLLNLGKIKFLVDPVFSGNASPLPNNVKEFAGTEYYKSDKMPYVDYLIITHDHYDHLDYKTILELKNKVGKVILPLGVSEHFLYWGYKKENIIELEWYESFELSENFTITSEPTHHSSGRFLKPNQSLWTSYVLKYQTKNIFLGGDGAYGKHFKEIGKKYVKFDLAFMENGQYNKLWKYSHMFPKETLQAAKDINAQVVVPIHNSKFKLSVHEWNEPLKEITRLNKEEFKLNLVTMKIGDVVYLDNLNFNYERWFDKN
ncbi:MBL fold metallo-hydrolase [Gemella sp. zg-1178]|uniref:MBL fold metallo-hydrolase n=1 Tax=Gemella sp. zg-1178 TaxID=2840372 RepID=UPI001C052EB8|nr:MBL fold metallo-hydrolase [Gemella sp. zg-1178]MBU0279107.1 MBL fold metallo-hydrolase [Gemella sp. zg-1178]